MRLRDTAWSVQEIPQPSTRLPFCTQLQRTAATLRSRRHIPAHDSRRPLVAPTRTAGHYSVMISAPGCAAYSAQEPSYKLTCGAPQISSPSARTAAVMPEPQVVVTGCCRSIPFCANKARSAGAGSMRSPSVRVVYGRLTAPGMCPAESPGLGSGAVPSKRPVDRASSTCTLCSRDLCSAAKSLTAAWTSRALKSAGARCTGPDAMGRPASVQARSPPSSKWTFSAPKVRSIHHARGAEKTAPCS